MSSDHAVQNLRTTSIGLSMWLLLRSRLGITLSCSVRPIVHYSVPASIPETLSLGSCNGGACGLTGLRIGRGGGQRRTDFSRGVRDWSQPRFSSSQLSPVCVMVRSCHIARRNAEGRVGEEFNRQAERSQRRSSVSI